MTTFALIHGAGTVGASWAAVAALLEAHGHRVVAPDLPMEDTAATFGDYAAAVLAAIGAEDTDVVVAGHSMGGMVVPLLAARRPVRATVYVAAMVPLPGRSLIELMRAEPMLTPATQAAMQPGSDGLLYWDPDAAEELLFEELAPERAEQARAGMRGHATAVYRPAYPLEALPDVPATYVACAGDRVISPEWGRTTGAARLGAELAELPGGHMPMLTRPRELAAVLERAATGG